MAKKEIGKKVVDIAKGFVKKEKPKVTTTPQAQAQGQLPLPGITIPTVGTPLATAEAAKKGLRQTLLGSKPRQLATVTGLALGLPPAAAIGGALTGLYGQYANLFSGGGPAPMETPIDYSQVYNPQTALEQTYATMRQNLAGQVPSQQAELDRLQQFSQMMGRGGTTGTGVSRGAGSNVYEEQANRIRQANVPSTATSGVTPMAGPLAAQADALIRQGATLNDYLGFMERAAASAGVKMDQDTRMRLYTMATNSYYKKVNEVQDALMKLDQQYLQAQTQLASQPQFIVDQSTIDLARQRQAAGGNQLPLETYLNQAAREYYRNLNQG